MIFRLAQGDISKMDMVADRYTYEEGEEWCDLEMFKAHVQDKQMKYDLAKIKDLPK